MNLWRCFDKTKNLNKWIDKNGTIIAKDAWTSNIDYKWSDITIIQGTWTFYASTNQTDFSLNWVPSAGVNNNTTKALGDGWITKQIKFVPGNYEIRIMTYTSSNKGITTVYLGANQIGTYDSYSSSIKHNVEIIINTTITTIAELPIKCMITDKNASSSGYATNSSWLKINKI